MEIYKSKIDTWLLLVLAGSAIACLIAAYTATQQGDGVMTGLLILALGAGLPLWILASTKYVVADQSISVRSGPFFWTIQISSISSVRETRNLLSSPALSLDRIELEYGAGKKIMISPADKAGFRKAIGHPET
ncbi:hypothetical protein EYC98_11070 [Halieaceae bacterium IMCC14734]|uniref:Uncharacterized protein YyaB-like PH domain-containing protein n=1 Tax=Candidatus Litorirhabdus singularis TaxID=2518993 RepID=A0ABT3TGS6_9GAMM|nr:PH domain-containing protein [Candidatus Litorirhabdus singularis]MCX2981405.1 hypothetical protein [Candidatus Litorirhabdus singularis]